MSAVHGIIFDRSGIWKYFSLNCIMIPVTQKKKKRNKIPVPN